jgi:predicted ester cyclase
VGGGRKSGRSRSLGVGAKSYGGGAILDLIDPSQPSTTNGSQASTIARSLTGEETVGQARETVESFFELFAAGKITDATELFDPSCITVMPAGALTQAEHEGMGRAFKAGLPDCYMAVDRIVESGDEIVVLGHFKGTHSGDLQSPGGTIPASGKALNLRFMDYFKVVGGMIVDHQTIFDQIEMLTQLGALPEA